MRSLSRTVRPAGQIGKQRAHVALALVACIVDGDQQLLAVPGVGPGQEVIPRSVAVPGRHAFQQGPLAFPHSRLSEHRQETRRVRSEVLPLTWAQVDFAAGTVRLEVRTTKNDRGRTFVMTPDLRALLGAQRKVTPGACPYVFHWAGRPLRSFYKSWRSACLAAGLGTLVSQKPRRIATPRLPHDFRRTACSRSRPMVADGSDTVLTQGSQSSTGAVISVSLATQPLRHRSTILVPRSECDREIAERPSLT